MRSPAMLAGRIMIELGKIVVFSVCVAVRCCPTRLRTSGALFRLSEIPRKQGQLALQNPCYSIEVQNVVGRRLRPLSCKQPWQVKLGCCLNRFVRVVDSGLCSRGVASCSQAMAGIALNVKNTALDLLFTRARCFAAKKMRSFVQLSICSGVSSEPMFARAQPAELYMMNTGHCLWPHHAHFAWHPHVSAAPRPTSSSRQLQFLQLTPAGVTLQGDQVVRSACNHLQLTEGRDLLQANSRLQEG